MATISDPHPQPVVSSLQGLVSLALLFGSCAGNPPSGAEERRDRYCSAIPAFLGPGSFFLQGWKALAESVIPGNPRPSQQHLEVPLYSSAEPSWACNLGEACRKGPSPAGEWGHWAHRRKSLSVLPCPCCQHAQVGTEGCLAVSDDETSL